VRRRDLLLAGAAWTLSQGLEEPRGAASAAAADTFPFSSQTVRQLARELALTSPCRSSPTTEAETLCPFSANALTSLRRLSDVHNKGCMDRRAWKAQPAPSDR
jgi:hypothetical protein